MCMFTIVQGHYCKVDLVYEKIFLNESFVANLVFSKPNFKNLAF